MYIVIYLQRKYIDKASEGKKRRMCQKKKKKNSSLIRIVRGMKRANYESHPYPTVCTKSQMSEMTNDHIQNHYFEYGRVNKIDEIFRIMEIIPLSKLIGKNRLTNGK